MEHDEVTYDTVREEFRSDVREVVIEETTLETYEELSNDERLALVIDEYDPDEYTEEEKVEMVDERDGEIRDVIREQIVEEEGDDIDRRIETRLSDSAAAMGEEVDEDEDEQIEVVAASIFTTFVIGLTGELSYEEFIEEVANDRAELASVVANQFRVKLDTQLPETIDLTEGMDDETVAFIDSVRNIVSTLSILVIALPVLALASVGVLVWVSESPVQAVMWTGIAATFGGIPWVVSLWIADRQVTTMTDETESESVEFIHLIQTLVQDVLAVGMVQSIVLVSVGGVALVSALAIRFELVSLPER